MEQEYFFPFGEKVRKVEQKDRTAKDLFVLGVYASAVHAKWLSPDNQVVVQALAVASEPEIFWRGDGAATIIKSIYVPPELGKLEAANKNLNGPSGRTLDEEFLKPLGYMDRSGAWLCDLVPYSRLNPNQARAIRKFYEPERVRYNLPQATIPPLSLPLTDDLRRDEIIQEIESAQPKLIILLGDEPIEWFLAKCTTNSPKTLANFSDEGKYGMPNSFEINGKRYDFLLLVHPRQAGAISVHSKKWNQIHEKWVKEKAPEVGREFLDR